jgi:hypothetical protein
MTASHACRASTSGLSRIEATIYPQSRTEADSRRGQQSLTSSRAIAFFGELRLPLVPEPPAGHSFALEIFDGVLERHAVMLR